jgi:hypothetical protein
VYTVSGQSQTQQYRDASTAIHVPQKQKNHMHVSKLLFETRPRPLDNSCKKHD